MSLSRYQHLPASCEITRFEALQEEYRKKGIDLTVDL